MLLLYFENDAFDFFSDDYSLLHPIKKPKKGELSAAEKAFNKELSRRRIVIENINAEITG